MCRNRQEQYWLLLQPQTSARKGQVGKKTKKKQKTGDNTSQSVTDSNSIIDLQRVARNWAQYNSDSIANIKWIELSVVGVGEHDGNFEWPDKPEVTEIVEQPLTSLPNKEYLLLKCDLATSSGDLAQYEKYLW